MAAPTLVKYQEFSTPATSFVTSAWTPVAARLHFAWVELFKASATVGTPTASGNGLTWDPVPNGTTDAADGSTKRGVLFAAYGSGTAGAFTVGGLGGVTHSKCIVTIVEQSGPTTLAAIVQAVTDRSYNTNLLTLTLGTIGGAAHIILGFFGSKGSATGISPGSGFTWLVNDQIDTDHKAYVEYRLTADTTVDVTLTGAPAENYNANHTWGVAVEVANAAPGWTVQAEMLLDVPEVVVEEPPPIPPDVVDVAAPPEDEQSPGARPHLMRGSDLVRIMGAVERRQAALEGRMVGQAGFLPSYDADPVDLVDNMAWIRSDTGELCWRVGGVTQRQQPSTPPITPPGGGTGGGGE